MAKSQNTGDIGGTFEHAKDDVMEAASSARSWVEDELDVIRDTARAEPIKMLLIAAGVGALIGRIFL